MPTNLPLHHDTQLVTLCEERMKEDWRYCAYEKRWYEFSGSVWLVMSSQAVVAKVEPILELLGRGENEDVQRRLASHDTCTMVANHLATRPSMRMEAHEADKWNADPYLLNVPNGVIDLRVPDDVADVSQYPVTLLRHGPQTAELLMSRQMRSPIAEEDTPTPETDKLFQFMCEDDPERVEFIWRYFGRAMIGIQPRAWLFAWGRGGNGKSTMIEMFSHLFGTYHTSMNVNYLIEQKFPPHDTGWAKLRGARLITATDVPKGRLNPVAFKRLGGGDTITARFMRQDEIDFRLSGSAAMSSNGRLDMGTGGEAIADRANYVTFPRRLEELYGGEHGKIDNYGPILAEQEGPGIMRKLVQACRRQQRDNDYKLPSIWQIATAEVLAEAEAAGSDNPVRDWLDDRTDTVPPQRVALDGHMPQGGGMLLRAACQDFNSWCRGSNRPQLQMKMQSFGNALRDMPILDDNGLATARYYETDKISNGQWRRARWLPGVVLKGTTTAGHAAEFGHEGPPDREEPPMESYRSDM